MRVLGLVASALALALLGVSPAEASDDEVLYYQPFQYGEIRGVTCGNEMGSHRNRANRYAIDYDLPVGTPVCAAAAGEVISVIEGNDGPTGNPANNNEVVVRHTDGHVTVYTHLRKDGAVVEKGDKVERGDLIAYSGNTGATSGPHLHFAVMARHRGPSIPFRFADFGGSGVPAYGNRVTSFNFPIRFQRPFDRVQAALRARNLARALDCPEIALKAYANAADVAMPMKLRVLTDALTQRDRALQDHENAAIGRLRAIADAEAADDLETAVRLAVLGKRDFAGSGQAAALRKALARLEKTPGYRAAYESLRDEWAFRPKLLAAARAELGGKDAKTVARLWNVALKAAPERLRLTVDAHLAVIDAGLTQGEVGYSQPYEWKGVRHVIAANGNGHHTDARNRYAFDFSMPIGTPVLASAAGVVVAVRMDTIGPTGRAEDDNLVAIRHADGMVSVYRHLEFRSSVVAVGQKVGRGDFIAYSGATGNVDPALPHLHFGLQRSVDGASVPFRFIDVAGSGVPNQWDMVTSFNFPSRYVDSNLALRAAVRAYDLATRFGCIEAGGRRLAGVRETRYDMPLRSLWEPVRLRDSAWADYEERAAAALTVVEDTDAAFGDRVRATVFGEDDYARSTLAARFETAVAGLRGDPRFAAANAALGGEREYRRHIEFAIRSDVDGRDDRSVVLTRYRLALRSVPEASRAALEAHVDALAADSSK